MSCADTTWVRKSLLRTSITRDKAAGQSGAEGTKPDYEALQLLSPEIHSKALPAEEANPCLSLLGTDWGHGASRGQNSIGSLRVTLGRIQQAWTAGAQALGLSAGVLWPQQLPQHLYSWELTACLVLLATPQNILNMWSCRRYQSGADKVHLPPAASAARQPQGATQSGGRVAGRHGKATC